MYMHFRHLSESCVCEGYTISLMAVHIISHFYYVTYPNILLIKHINDDICSLIIAVMFGMTYCLYSIWVVWYLWLIKQIWCLGLFTVHELCLILGTLIAHLSMMFGTRIAHQLINDVWYTYCSYSLSMMFGTRIAHQLINDVWYMYCSYSLSMMFGTHIAHQLINDVQYHITWLGIRTMSIYFIQSIYHWVVVLTRTHHSLHIEQSH